MFAGKKRMGQRGRKERVSLYLSTSCFFSCVRIDCQRWYEVHVGGLFDLVWVQVAYLVWKFGLRGLWHCFWQVSDSVCTTVLTVTLSKKKKTALRAVFLS